MTGASINAPIGLPFLNALERWRIKVHHWRMTNDFQLIVHFSCPHCAAVYTASQEEQAERRSGDFHCGRCGAPVHECDRHYDYSHLEPANTTCRTVRPSQ